MSHGPRTKVRRVRRRRGDYLLRLFVVGNGPNSRQALSNLRSLCREHLDGRCTIETVDVVKDFQAAVRNNILVTPRWSLWLRYPGWSSWAT